MRATPHSNVGDSGPSTSPPALGDGKGFWTVGQVAAFLGVCPNTARSLIDSGEIESYRTIGNQRRVSARSVWQYAYGFDPEEEEEGTGEVGIYVRVSSESQDQKGSLQRQTERLLGEVSQREGLDEGEISVFKDVASSFGSRSGLNSFVDSVIARKVKRLYCEYQDRLSRVPALTRLVEHLCQRYGVEIVCLDKQETNPDDLQAAMAELLSFATVVANRISSQKSKAARQK